MKPNPMNTVPVEDGENNFSIEVVEHQPFPEDFKTASMSTAQLADIISSFFKPVFSDYAGCRVCVYLGKTGNGIAANPAAGKLNLPAGAVYVDLFFRDNAPGDGIKSLSVVGGHKDTFKKNTKKVSKDNPTENLTARIISQNRVANIASNGITYEVSDETYQMLEPFRFNQSNINPIRWADQKTEIFAPMHPNSSKHEAVVCISCLDVNAIVSAIYGTDEGDKKNKYAYTVSPTTPIPLNNEYLVHIVQMDTDVISRTSAELGMNMVNNIGFHSC